MAYRSVGRLHRTLWVCLGGSGLCYLILICFLFCAFVFDLFFFCHHRVSFYLYLRLQSWGRRWVRRRGLRLLLFFVFCRHLFFHLCCCGGFRGCRVFLCLVCGLGGVGLLLSLIFLAFFVVDLVILIFSGFYVVWILERLRDLRFSFFRRLRVTCENARMILANYGLLALGSSGFLCVLFWGFLMVPYPSLCDLVL